MAKPQKCFVSLVSLVLAILSTCCARSSYEEPPRYAPPPNPYPSNPYAPYPPNPYAPNPYGSSHQSLRALDEFHAKLKQDLRALEQRAMDLSEQECTVGEEVFEICNLDDNAIDFLICLCTPHTYGQLSREIVFPSSQFYYPPAVAVGIKALGTVAYGDVKVRAENVNYHGFVLIVEGGYPAYLYSLTVQWVACPRHNPFTHIVEEHKPTYYPPPTYNPQPYGPPQPSYQPPPPSYNPPPRSYNPPAPSYNPPAPSYNPPPPSYNPPQPSYYPQPPSYNPPPPSYNPPPYGYPSPPAYNPPPYGYSPPPSYNPNPNPTYQSNSYTPQPYNPQPSYPDPQPSYPNPYPQPSPYDPQPSPYMSEPQTTYESPQGNTYPATTPSFVDYYKNLTANGD